MSPAKPPAGSLGWLSNKLLHSISFGLAMLFVVSLVLFHFSDFRKPAPDVVRIAYGAGGPVRRHYLEEMAAHGAKWNLDIRLVPTKNTDTTLSMVDGGDVDMGLIAGAMEDKAARRITEITPLYMEPLQLVVKAEFYDEVSRDFGQLRGKSISMDGVDSATSVLATELLRFIGLTDPATGKPAYREEHLSQSQLVSPTGAGTLPDAIFQIGGVPSATIAYLVAKHNYRVVALPFGGAFNLSKFRESAPSRPVPGARLTVNKSFVEEAVIPAYVYGVLPAVPAADTRTIAARLLLVGGKDLDADVVKRVLGLVMSPDISHIVEPKLSVELLDAEFQFPRHPGVEAYTASLKPFNVEGAFTNYQRVGEIWGILVALFLAVTNGWKWLKERRERKARHSVGEFMAQILEVEAGVDAAVSDTERRALDQRLSEIKRQSIELHLDGRLEDAEDLHALLVALADTRSRVRGAVA